MQPVIATQRSAFGHLKPVHGLSNGRKISWDKLLRACSEAMQGEPCSRKHRRFPLGRWYRSTAWAGASSVQSWRLTWPFLKSEYSFWITANSLCLYWCLTANVTSSRRERKAKGPTRSETWLTSAGSTTGSGETKILNFTSNWGSLPDPAMFQTNLSGTKLRPAHEREGSTSSSLAPAPAQGLVGQGEQGKHRVPIIPASKPHPRTPAHNGATSDATDLPRAKRNPSSSTQLTDTACAAFISCSNHNIWLGFFSSDQLLKFADTNFCVALQQLTQQWLVLRPPSIQRGIS